MNKLPFEIDASHKFLEEPFIKWCADNKYWIATEEACRPWWDCFLFGATLMFIRMEQEANKSNSK